MEGCWTQRWPALEALLDMGHRIPAHVLRCLGFQRPPERLHLEQLLPDGIPLRLDLPALGPRFRQLLAHFILRGADCDVRHSTLKAFIPWLSQTHSGAETNVPMLRRCRQSLLRAVSRRLQEPKKFLLINQGRQQPMPIFMGVLFPHHTFDEALQPGADLPKYETKLYRSNWAGLQPG